MIGRAAPLRRRRAGPGVRRGDRVSSNSRGSDHRDSSRGRRSMAANKMRMTAGGSNPKEKREKIISKIKIGRT